MHTRHSFLSRSQYFIQYVFFLVTSAWLQLCEVIFLIKWFSKVYIFQIFITYSSVEVVFSFRILCMLHYHIGHTWPSVLVVVWSFRWYLPKISIVGTSGRSIPSSLRYRHIDFHNGCVSSHSQPQWRNYPCFPSSPA